MRVALIADDPLARAGLFALLDRVPTISVVFEGAARDELSALFAQSPTDAVVWDLGLDPLASSAALEALSRSPSPVVALVSSPSAASEALSSGARALLPRNAAIDAITAALTAVTAGLIALDQAFADLQQRPSATRDSLTDAGSDELTAREREVLQLLSEALSNKQIAQRLDISEHTVKFHVNAILTKLGAQSRTDAVVRAARIGLVIL